MRIIEHKLFRYCTVAACAFIVATGCRLERRPIVSWAKVEPAQYCSGDTLTASYDFLATETCPADASCSTYFPNVNISSTPTSFPTRAVNNFTDSFTFTPVGDSVNVLFDIDRETVRVPTSRFDGTLRVFVDRSQVLDTTRTARRTIGMIESELIHGGMCAGSTPVHSPASLPGPPALSPNMRLVELCNFNTVPVNVTLSGSPSGVTHSQRLMPRECVNTSAPGVPTGTDGSRMIAVNALIADPSARCGVPTLPDSPPPQLRTVARMACR